MARRCKSVYGARLISRSWPAPNFNERVYFSSAENRGREEANRLAGNTLNVQAHSFFSNPTLEMITSHRNPGIINKKNGFDLEFNYSIEAMEIFS